VILSYTLQFKIDAKLCSKWILRPLRLLSKHLFMRWATGLTKTWRTSDTQKRYRAFHRFGQAKICNGGSALGSSQFLLLPQLLQKTALGLKVVKIETKIVILIRQFKAIIHSEQQDMVIQMDLEWTLEKVTR